MAAAASVTKANAVARRWRPEDDLAEGPAIDADDDDGMAKGGSRRNSSSRVATFEKQQTWKTDSAYTLHTAAE